MINYLRSYIIGPILSIVVFTWILILVSNPSAAWISDLKTFTLNNGLQVVVVEDHRLPLISHMVWYRVGSADEPPGKSGLAHLLEHMMFKGTQAAPTDTFSKTVARNGGTENANTFYDFTVYYQTIAANQLELVMRMEADRMLNLTFGASAFRTEHEVVCEERRGRVDNTPAVILSERVEAVLWGEHPYGHPIIGWEHELKTLSQDDIVNFYHKWYSPNNVFVIVAGDVTINQVRFLADKYYGVILPRATPERARSREHMSRASNTVIEMHHRNVEQPWWSRAYVAPSYRSSLYSSSSSNQDGILKKHLVPFYAMQVLAELFGGGISGRLYQALVEQQKLAVMAEADYDWSMADFSAFHIHASPRPNVGMPTMITAIEAEIKQLLESGVTHEEVTRAKARLQAQEIYLRDSFEEGFWHVGVAMSLGQSVDDIAAWGERLSSVTPEDVMTIARLVLEQSRHVSGILLPDPSTFAPIPTRQ